MTHGGLSPELLNREAGFGVNPTFSFELGDPAGLNAGLHHLLLLCWRSRQTGTTLGEPFALHPAVSRAVKLLSEKEWNRDFAALAKACRVSEAHLSRTFHQQIGLSLGNYRTSLRLSRFWEHYRQPTRTTLADAVYAAGFGCYAQFYKVFVQAYGRCPRACIAEGVPTAAPQKQPISRNR